METRAGAECMRALRSRQESRAYPKGWRQTTERTGGAAAPGNNLWGKLETGCLLISISCILQHIKLGTRVAAASEATRGLDEEVFERMLLTRPRPSDRDAAAAVRCLVLAMAWRAVNKKRIWEKGTRETWWMVC